MSFRLLAVVDTQSGEAATVALADVAADMGRYQLLGPAGDSAVISDPAQGGGSR